MKKNILTYSKMLLLLLALYAYPFSVNSKPNYKTGKFEKNEINGKVTSENGEALEGVTVQLKGSHTATTTRTDGAFNLSLEDNNATILFSLVGYQPKEIKLSGQKTLQVTLEKSSKVLESVVVVGYGTQRKKDVTGAVASVPLNNVKQTPISSLDRVLQGNVSGVQVTQASGQPGSAVTIRIRGGNSINGGNEPLYVIDGFPVYNDNSTVNSGTLSGGSVNALATINANDIESIEVLKDASATAIYGSRGANGVVLITTKRGKNGRSQTDIEKYYGIQQVTRTLPLLNAQEWAQFKNDALINSGKEKLYTDAQIDSFGTGTDWQKESFRTAPVESHQLSITGGDEKTQYALSGNYFKQDGILLNSDFKRYSGRLNLDRIISERLKVGASITGSSITSNIPDGNVVRYILTMVLTVPLINPATGDYTLQSPYGSFGNPVATLKYVTNQSIINRFISNFYGEYKILKNLTARTTLGTDLISSKQNNYYPRNTYTGAQTLGFGAIGSQAATTWLNENTLHYHTAINSHHAIDVLAGYSYQQSGNEGVVARAQSFPNDQLSYTGLNSGTVSLLPLTSKSEWKLSSYLGRINYAFNKKYLFTLTGRADGSSRFGANKKWGFFPSAALAWNASDEDFVRSIAAISQLKIRTSAGQTGNQQIGQYQSLAQLDPYNYILGNNLVTGYAPSRIPNPNIGWETTYQYDAGFDLGLFNNRISLTFDAYYKKTKDLLLDLPVPETSGFYTSLQYIGAVENKGIEVLLNTDNISGAFNWNSTVAFSLNRNKVLDLGGLSYFLAEGGGERNIQKPTIVRVGEPVGEFYGYQMAGIFQSYDEISKSATVDAKTTKPGDRKFVDQNGDGKITQDGDRIVIGHAQPKFLGSSVTASIIKVLIYPFCCMAFMATRF